MTKVFRPRYFVSMNDSFAWNTVFSSLGKSDIDCMDIPTVRGEIRVLEVTQDELRKIEASAADKAYSFDAYQELFEGGYAHIEPPTRMKPVVRTTGDSKAREAVASLKERLARRSA